MAQVMLMSHAVRGVCTHLGSIVELDTHLWCIGPTKLMYNNVVSSVLRVLYVSKPPIGP